MTKRPMSKKWLADPDYEPPVTRRKVRDDPTIVIPRAQDVPLPRYTRKRRVRKVVAVAPPLQNAGELAREIEAKETPNGEVAKETPNGNQAKETPDGNQAKETQNGNQAKEVTTGNIAEEMASNSQIEVTMEQNPIVEIMLEDNMEEDLSTENQVEKTAEDQMKGHVSRDLPQETGPEKQLEALLGSLDIFDDTDDEVPCGQMVPRAAAGIRMAEVTPSVDSAPWTDNDQRTLEAEIREMAGKPEDKRSYTWNLIVGKPSGSQTGSSAPDLRRGQPERSSKDGSPWAVDKSPILARQMTTAASSATTGSFANPDSDNGEKSREVVTMEGYMGEPDSFLGEFSRKRPRSAMDRPVQHLPPATAERQTGPPAIPMNAHPPFPMPQRAENDDARRGPRNDPPPPLDESSVMRALRRNAMLLYTEPVQPKPDIITERRFIVHPQLQGLELPDASNRISIVSYNIMAELEKEDTRQVPPGVEFSEEARGGRGKRAGKRGGKERTPADLLPTNHVARIIQELYYLDADIFCLQSISNWSWSRLEKTLLSWGFSNWRKNRRPGTNNCCEAIFFRTKRFELVKSGDHYLDDLVIMHTMGPDVAYNTRASSSINGREVVVFVTLRCKTTGRRLMVANTRCTPEHMHRPDLQSAQACCIVQTLANMNATAGERLPIILCGNFDFQPNQGPYQVLRDGSISNVTQQGFDRIQTITDNDGQRCSLSSAYPVVFQHTMPSIRSAYAKVMGTEPPNVWKRESQTFVCGSYVWYEDAQLSVVGVLDNVAARIITEGSGIPNNVFPSGSLSLKAVFKFRDDMPGNGDRQDARDERR